MIPFQRMSIHNKLAFALGGAVLLAFAVASIALAFFGSLTLERRARQIMEPYAHLVSVGAEAAVAFEDPGRAREILATLRANPQILEAEIVLRDGRLLARYASTKATFHPHPPRPDGLYLVQNRAELIQSLPEGAHLHIVMSLDELNRHTRNVLLLFAAGVLVLLVATTLGLRSALQRTIVRPISTLAETVEQVRTLADYHRRVPASGADEVARLGQSFNAMMGAIQERDNDLGRLTLFQRTILDNAAHGIISTSPDGIVSSFNPAAERLLGYTADEVVGKLTPECWHDPEEIARRALRLSEELGETILPGFDLLTARPRRNLPEENEWTFIRKDGTRVPVLLSVTALRDESGRITGFVGMTYDLSERKRAEEALRYSEELLRITLENILDPIFITDDEGRFTFICGNVSFVLGYTVEEIRAMGNISALLGEGLFSLEELERRGEIRNIDCVITNKDGSSNDYFVTVKRVSIKGGTLLYVCRDITERKQAEEALREGEAFLNILLNAIPIPVFYKDRDGRYLGFNSAYETFFGATRDRLIGKTAFDISPRELAECYHAKDTELFESGGVQQYESQVKNAHGVLRDIIFNKAVFTDSQGTIIGLIGAILDITERKRAEEDILKLNDELRSLNEELEERVKERTAELEKKNAELHKMNRLFVGRELRMVELKEKIKELESKLGQQEP
jgi:PAS domain S-box-containing protein